MQKQPPAHPLFLKIKLSHRDLNAFTAEGNTVFIDGNIVASGRDPEDACSQHEDHLHALLYSAADCPDSASEDRCGCKPMRPQKADSNCTVRVPANPVFYPDAEKAKNGLPFSARVV